jgi:hypothetical protein
VASIRLKVLRFDIDPIIGPFPGNITDLGHPEVHCRLAMAGDAKSKLKRILPLSYRKSQGKIRPVKEKVSSRGRESPEWSGLRMEDQSEELCGVPSSIGE